MPWSRPPIRTETWSRAGDQTWKSTVPSPRGTAPRSGQATICRTATRLRTPGNGYDCAMRCTYRLQLLPHLTFAAARELVPYLRNLGVSHLYLSPSLQARSGSTHGYDVVDPTRISVDLGGEDAFRALAGAGLDVILDVVPNHMAAVDENPFWVDPERRRRFFDIDPHTGLARRFFDIDDLAGVRVEDEEVFATTHAVVLGLVREGVVAGLRIDHPDGLADPAGYLRRLRDAGVAD